VASSPGILSVVNGVQNVGAVAPWRHLDDARTWSAAEQTGAPTRIPGADATFSDAAAGDHALGAGALPRLSESLDTRREMATRARMGRMDASHTT